MAEEASARGKGVLDAQLDELKWFWWEMVQPASIVAGGNLDPPPTHLRGELRKLQCWISKGRAGCLKLTGERGLMVPAILVVFWPWDG